MDSQLLDCNGLDSEGFILNNYTPDNIQPEFANVVDATVKGLLEELPGKIHGIYLYGSVARGNAALGQSDLDLSIIMSEPLTPHDREVLKALQKRVSRLCPEVSKVDFDPGYIEDVLLPKEKYSWQFWLKHCCCCIWGNDLSQQFPLFKPSIEIALALNGDLESFLEQYALDDCSKNAQHLPKLLGKKLIRSAYYFIAAKDASWYTNLPKCYETAVKYYPEQRKDMDLAYACATGKDVSVEEAFELFRRLSINILPRR